MLARWSRSRLHHRFERRLRLTKSPPILRLLRRRKKRAHKKDKLQPSPQKSLGWGSNIQNARLARAAEMALKDGKYAAALDFAQRAAQGSAQRSSIVVPAGLRRAPGGKNSSSPSILTIRAFA